MAEYRCDFCDIPVELTQRKTHRRGVCTECGREIYVAVNNTDGSVVVARVGGIPLDPDCGGCNGVGSHRRHCRRNPAYEYRLELADWAESLADAIGSNDPEAANIVYTAEARLRSGVGWAK